MKLLALLLLCLLAFAAGYLCRRKNPTDPNLIANRPRKF